MGFSCWIVVGLGTVVVQLFVKEWDLFSSYRVKADAEVLMVQCSVRGLLHQTGTVSDSLCSAGCC